jgi:hypothetical protein
MMKVIQKHDMPSIRPRLIISAFDDALKIFSRLFYAFPKTP